MVFAYGVVLAVKRGIGATNREGVRAENGVGRVVDDADSKVAIVERGTGISTVGQRRRVGCDTQNHDAENDRNESKGFRKHCGCIAVIEGMVKTVVRITRESSRSWLAKYKRLKDAKNNQRVF